MSWIRIGSDIDAEAAGDNFGAAVALSGDGTVMAIGAPYNDGVATSAGSVRVYKNINNTWTLIGSEINGLAAGDTHGFSLALSDDGTIIIIGSPLDNTSGGTDAGNVRIYKNVSNTWTRINAETGFDGGQAGGQQGYSVAISGNGLVAARGGIYSDNGSATSAGSVRAFSYVSGTTWNTIDTFIYGEAAGDLSGYSIQLSNDGTVMAIGAAFNNGNGTDSGSVRVYKNVSGNWTKISNDVTFDGSAAGDHAGIAVAMNGDGTIIAVGSVSASSDTGHVRVFTYVSGTTWTKIGFNINGQISGDQFGSGLALSSDGTILAVGSQYHDVNGTSAGMVAMYKNIDYVWTQIGPNIYGEAAGDRFGYSVALSNDGTILAIGAPYNDGIGTDAGHAKVFKYIPTPNAPSISSVTISQTTATINFTQTPSDATITSYTYVVSTNGGSYGSPINSNWTSGTSFTVTGLILGNNYSFKLTAKNGSDSPESVASNTVTVENFAPNQPTSVSASVSLTTATISFTPGVSNGSAAVNKYYYAVSRNGGGYGSELTVSSWSSGTSFTITGLIPDNSYAFKLTAFNGTYSTASDASNTITVANFAPSTPTSLVASVLNGTATINFTQNSNGSNAITSYRYSIKTNNGNYSSFIDTNLTKTSATQVTISGLFAGNSYSFKLQAFNGIYSADSLASNTVTVSNFAPPAPTSLSASVSGRTATINFTQGTNNSNAVTSYTYAVSTDSGLTYGSFINTNLTKISATQVTISQLSPGTSYSFKLKSYNGIDSAESLASNTITVNNSPPNRPTNINVSVTGITVTISFTPGAFNGSDIISYKYAVSTNDGAYSSFTTSNWTSGSSFTFTGDLVIGFRYNFILIANNGIDSAQSDASNQVTIQNFAPSRPTISSVSVSGRTATINFTPGVPNGSSIVSGYKYAVRTNGGTYGEFTNSNWISGSQITVSNLLTGFYNFKLIANNGIDSIESDASNQIDIVPDAPVIRRIDLSGLTSVIITFNQPGINSTDVNSYQYAFKTSVGGAYSLYRDTNLSWTQGTFSLTISNLTPGLTYYYKLKAYKNTIASNDSNESSGIFINFAPATPQISYIDAFNGTAKINFTLSNNGSLAISKYVYSTDSPVTSNSVFYEFPLINGLEQTISPLIINRLTNGTTYSFTIRGTNGIDSQASNTINDIVMSSAIPSPRITDGKLIYGTATLYIGNSDPATITNYAYSTNSIDYTPFNPVQNTSILTITGLSQSASVSLSVKAINGTTNFSTQSNQITIIPMFRQPPITINASSATAKDFIARIPFSQTLISSNGTDAIVKYVYCTDNIITESSVFIDVPLRDGNVQTANLFVIPFTISNPATTPSISFTFKSYTNGGLYSLASTTTPLTILYPQPPPTILSAQGDGNGNLIITIKITSLRIYSYAPSITSYAFSTDEITYIFLNNISNTYKISLPDTSYNSITMKSFNGSYSAPSNTVSNVIIRYSAPAVPVITSVTGNMSAGAVVNFTQDITGLTKDITGFEYIINNKPVLPNLSSSSRSFTINASLLSNGENILKMRSTNGKMSGWSTDFSFNIVSVDRATYIDPSDSINTILIRQTAINQSIQFSTDNENWTNIGNWPFTIGNNSPDTNLKVKFDTNINLPYNLINRIGNYFILSSRNIIIDGNNKTVTVNNYPNFPGLITNGTGFLNGYNNTIIKNISIVSTGISTLSVGQGWICKDYFGKGSTGNIIQNCSSNGTISGNGGGITGQCTAINSTNFSIIGCSASGNILEGAAGGHAGGIVGSFSGTNSTSFTITTCTYSGNINGNGSGGIIGGRSTDVSISFCSTSGIIKGGGIAGDYIGIPTYPITPNKVYATISDCFTTGDIGSGGSRGAVSAGGIIAERGGIVTITRCYSFGEIGGVGKIDCGGIVGGIAGQSGSQISDGAVVVQSCFSTGNIYDGCGGIAAGNFGYGSISSNSFNNGIYDCYSLGNIGARAGGIAGPEFANNAEKMCFISRCYSLGKLANDTSGGIIGITTKSYPTDIRTVSITNCFNSFSDSLVGNSIVGSGFPVTGVIGLKPATIPKSQTVNSISYVAVEQNTYLDALNKYPTTWTKLKLSTDTQRSILRAVNGYYLITPLIISNVPFIKIPLLGFRVSELLINAGLFLKDLISFNIDLTAAKNEFEIAGISIGDLFTAEYSVDIINRIGYTLSNILSIKPNISFKELIDNGINLKKSTPSYTISQVIDPSVQPVLTILDIIKAGFPISDIKGRPEAIFDLKTMKDAEVPVRYLLGPGGYSSRELKKLAFDVDDFRVSGFPVKTIMDDYGFKPLEFQGSKFPIESYASVIKTNVVSASMLETLGFPKSDAAAAVSLYSQQTNSTTFSIDTYISLNIPVSEIPKTLVITNIKNYWDTQQISSNPRGKNTYNPNDFLNHGWTKTQIGQMGFSARVLLDSGRFDLSDLKTLAYSDAAILASGHRLATTANVANADIYTAQNPPIITRIITDESNMYVYLDFIENNTADDPISIGYSFDDDSSNLVFEPVSNPFVIPNPDWSVDNSLFLTAYNGEMSPFNSVSVAKYKKPINKSVKMNYFKIGLGVALVVVATIIKKNKVARTFMGPVTGFMLKQGIKQAAEGSGGNGYIGTVLTTINSIIEMTSPIYLAQVGLGAIGEAAGINLEALGVPVVTLSDVYKRAGGIVNDVGGLVTDIAGDISDAKKLVAKDPAGIVTNFNAEKLGFKSRDAWTEGKWAFHAHKIDKIDSRVYIYDVVSARSALDTYYYFEKVSVYSDIVTGKTLGPKRAITQNKIYLTSKPTITSVVADQTKITVHFTGSMINHEDLDNIFYSLDNNKTWQTAGDTVQTSSPFVITGEFKLYEEMNISIRFYDKTDIDNQNSKFNVFAMNDYYSNTTSSGKCTYPIKIGKFGEPSNIVPVKMNFLPLVPELYYVHYNSKTSPMTRFYFVQNINCSGNIIDYEWTIDKGKTWTSAGKNFIQLPPALTNIELGSPVTLGKFTSRLTYFDIFLGLPKPSYSVMIRAVNSRNLRSNSSVNITSGSEEIAVWINKPANSAVYEKIRM